MITQAELQQLLHYDPNTGVFTWRVRRGGTARPGARAGILDNRGYRILQINKKLYKAHRLVWLYMTGSFPTKHLDHINGIPDDNSWSNLREATVAENGQNRKVSKNNTSGYTGVGWHKKSQKWNASIWINQRYIYLGRYDTPEEAARAYKEAKARYHTFNPVLRDSI